MKKVLFALAMVVAAVAVFPGEASAIGRRPANVQVVGAANVRVNRFGGVRVQAAPVVVRQQFVPATTVFGFGGCHVGQSILVLP